MASLTSILNLSRNALTADEAALNATANNVSNQNTPGYTREVANFQTQDYVTINGTYYGEGASETTTSVRDRVLEQRVQQQTQTAAQSDNLNATLNQVQNIFGLTSSTTSASTTTLGAALDTFYNSFSTLAANPSDTGTRTTVLSAAGSLAEAFNEASTQLASTQTQLDQQVNSITTQVNNLTSQIASLNKQIASYSPNTDAGVLEDQRQTAIASLSKLIGLDQISSENNGITLTTTGANGGALLVSAQQSYPITTSQVSGKTHLIAGFGGVDITSQITGGSLGGTLAARDTQVVGFQNTLDSLAYGVASAVNTQNEAGLDGSGNAGAAIFTVPASSANAAAVISVAGGVTPNSIAAAATGEGSTGATNATALANLADQTNVGGLTPSNFFATFLSQIGSAAAAATTDNTVQQTALTQLTSQRDSVSAVSLDEEASDLTQYQRSYEAASKIFTIVDQLLADSLNLGVEAAVS